MTNELLYLKFNKFPLKQAINKIPGELICDKFGNVYQVKSNFRIVRVLKTPLVYSELLLNLTELQYKLYKNIVNYELTIQKSK